MSITSTRERHAYAPLYLAKQFFNGSWNVSKVRFRAEAASAGRTDDANDPKAIFDLRLPLFEDGLLQGV